MSRSPEEQEVFDVVYQDRMAFLKQYPKTVAILSHWVGIMENQQPSDDMKVRVTQEATHKAYEDELKRLLLLSLITE